MSRAVTLAELRNTVPIAAAQFEHSLVQRAPEADLFPASHALGLGMVTWSPLGGGMLTGKYRRGESGRAEAMGGKVFQQGNNEQRTRILDAVLAIAAEHGASPDQVAIAWASSHGAVPMVGPRTPEQLSSNMRALDLTLTPDQLAQLNEVSAPAGATTSRLRALHVA